MFVGSILVQMVVVSQSALTNLGIEQPQSRLLASLKGGAPCIIHETRLSGQNDFRNRSLSHSLPSTQRGEAGCRRLPVREAGSVRTVTFQKQPSKEDSPSRHIAEALYSATVRALHIVGVQGGYAFKTPEKTAQLGQATVPYYYDRGEFLMPKLADIESQISNFIEEAALDALEKSPKVQFVRKASRIRTKTSIKKGKVVLAYEVSLATNLSSKAVGVTFNMKTPEVSFKSRLFEMYEIARYVTDSHKEDPEMIAINVLADMAEERHLKVEMLSIDGMEHCTLCVIRLDKREKENERVGAPSTFLFLNRYPEKPKKEEAKRRHLTDVLVTDHSSAETAGQDDQRATKTSSKLPSEQAFHAVATSDHLAALKQLSPLFADYTVRAMPESQVETITVLRKGQLPGIRMTELAPPIVVVLAAARRYEKLQEQFDKQLADALKESCKVKISGAVQVIHDTPDIVNDSIDPFAGPESLTPDFGQKALRGGSESKLLFVLSTAVRDRDTDDSEDRHYGEREPAHCSVLVDVFFLNTTSKSLLFSERVSVSGPTLEALCEPLPSRCAEMAKTWLRPK